MKPVNIYSLSCLKDKDDIKRLERQLSNREHFLHVKEWEIDGIKGLINHLIEADHDAYKLKFYYSFQIPKLGKEFDLLRISDEIIVNIELKSRRVSESAIKRQLTQNRYYLEMLGRTIRSYTYESEQDKLYRLTNSGRLVDAKWDELYKDISKQVNIYDGDIENLFKEVDYLISPTTDPDRFLRHEYFLTLQQKDIEKNIITNIGEKGKLLFGVKGLPGTGKTLLLYDLAMKLSESKRVCLIHCGAFPKELSLLNERLKRVDFMTPSGFMKMADDNEYSAIIIDEGHLLGKMAFEKVWVIMASKRIPVVFSYDSEDFLAPDERSNNIAKDIESLDGIKIFKLTNRIRTNNEIASFIQCLFHDIPEHAHRRHYPSIVPAYAKNREELANYVKMFKEEGYVLLDTKNAGTLGIEYEKVLVVLDETYSYDEEGYLRGNVRALYQTLNKAKQNLALVIWDNQELLKTILGIIQSRD